MLLFNFILTNKYYFTIMFIPIGLFKIHVYFFKTFLLNVTTKTNYLNSVLNVMNMLYIIEA